MSLALQVPRGTHGKYLKMKSIILVALALAAVAVAAPTEPIKILRYEFEPQPEGSYIFNFESENGIARNEIGEVKEAFDEENKPHNVVIVKGSYSYIDTDGKPQTVNYYADENGYHAEGEIIPKTVSRREAIEIYPPPQV